MIKPDFLIVGAMKGGTSSLAYILSHHKDIYIPKNEIFYFSHDKNYKKGPKWYLSKIGQASECKKLVGEKTASYHYISKSAKRIFDYNPNMKLIWILRDPIKRSYSQFWHVQKHGGESRTFEKAIEDEVKGLTENIWNRYIARSNYSDQIENYLKFFDKEQFHFMLFEDLVKSPLQETNKVLDFLGLKSMSQEEVVNEPRNVTFVSAYPKLLRAARSVFGRSLPFKIIRKVLERRKPGYSKMSNKAKLILKPIFKEQIIRLQKLTGLNLNSWQ
ncbi:MAG: sulfotransferase [Reichenbachiella sp.]|uniref:sulfotransferase family protein n=1 Tax=Reichenbachiella sp. TaxID=2184521 RepID=UPI0032674709